MNKITEIIVEILSWVQLVGGAGTLIASEVEKNFTIAIAGVIVGVCGIITKTIPIIINKIKELKK